MDADKTCIAAFGWPVGGIVVPISKLDLLAPWVRLAAMISLTALGAMLTRKHTT